MQPIRSGSGASKRATKFTPLFIALALGAAGVVLPGAAQAAQTAAPVPATVAASAVVNPPAAGPRPSTGAGAVQIENAANVLAGSTITIKGTGFSAKQGLSMKVNDGAYAVDNNQVIKTVEADDAGAFTTTWMVPADFAPGRHWVRFLDSDPATSQVAEFTVVAPNSQPSTGTPTAGTPGASPAPSVTAPVVEASVNAPRTAAEKTLITVTGEGWFVADGSAGSFVAVKLDRGAESRTFDLTGVSDSVNGNKTIWAAVEAERSGKFTLNIPLPDGTNNAPKAAWAPGSTHTITFLSGSMKEGDKVRAVNATIEVTAAAPAPSTSPSSTPSVAPTRPAGPPLCTVRNPNATLGPVPLRDGAAEFRTWVTGVETNLVGGLYQTAYSAKRNALYVTSAMGRPPAQTTSLLRLNADTLAFEKEVVPAIDPTATDREGNPVQGSRYAVYGVAVDDVNGRVWVTNTRQSTAAVYDADTLELVKQFEKGSMGHTRDVIVDSKRGRVYISMAFGTTIASFNAQTMERLEDIKLGETRDEFAVMSLALDEATGKLLTISGTTPKAAVIDTANNNAVKIVTLPDTVNFASGVAYDGRSGRIYVSSQASGDLTVVEEDGTKVAVVSTGAEMVDSRGRTVRSGALNVALDSINNLVYVANRNSGTITLHDLDGKLLQTLDSGKLANHVEFDGRGNVYAVNKGVNREGTSSCNYIQKYSAVPVMVELDAVEQETGKPIVITGTGFFAGDEVTAVMHSTPVEIGKAVADAQGKVTFNFVIPAGTALGNHEVILTGANGRVAKVGLVVKEAKAPALQPTDQASQAAPKASDAPTKAAPKPGAKAEGKGGKKLAKTGTDALGMTSVALLALVGGAGLLAARKRRG
ncbi:MAG: LPXTG cell wall anchor domain-containing protein [Buchananella hordeovulneris]|nr:LPXTG cell wall anchor domain-containing protein [Buchananella hordeovulneris]